MAGRPKAAATRANSRSKSTNTSVPVPTTGRTTRGASKADFDNNTEHRVPKNGPRKPLVNRANSPDTKSADCSSKLSANSSASKHFAKLNVPQEIESDADREPVKAFLRIRPRAGDGEVSTPYLESISETAVRMSDPSSSRRLSSVNGSSVYTFSHIFPPETQQADFFKKTTLPLVRDLLEGQNGLLFTYGVTNSGKTYTIQGGTSEGSAGILPRTLDVIFNSIDGLQGDDRYRPVRLQGIELASEMSHDGSPRSQYPPSSTSFPALADVLNDLPSAEIDTDIDTDPTVLKLDRNHEYTIWLSYSEVYNEKVYDLFASVESTSSSPSTPSQSTSGLPRPTSNFLNIPLPSSHQHPLLLTRKALPVKPCPPSDNDGSTENSGKYVAGLRQIRVRSAEEAKALLKLGQLHRRVFGTLANSQSSRSHALVTIKVLKVHRGERDDPTSIQTSRLTLVDLAGSERTKHTHTSGDRLREAGNINKSLMVLGQCMETLRANQRTIARSLAGSGNSGTGRVDTREVKKGLAIVPFRHSKLTEVLMDYFLGEGRAVMIVNVNPYDTGYDENSHVMKFSALAREVSTNPSVTAARPPPTPKFASYHGLSRSSEAGPYRRKVTISTSGPGRKPSETHLEVLEEDEEPGDGDSNDDEPINPLVDALFDEIEMLRLQLFESEMRCAVVEAETREEVMLEMEERMHDMEQMFTRRLMKEVEQHELKMDAKIDMLQQTHLLDQTTAQSKEQQSNSELSTALTTTTPLDVEETEGHSELSSTGGLSSRSEATSRSPSPLARRDTQDTRRSSSDHHEQDITPPTVEDAECSRMGVEQQNEVQYISSASSSDEVEGTESDSSEKPAPKGKYVKQVHPPPLIKARAKAPTIPTESSSGNLADLEELEQEMDELSLWGSPDDSIIILPDRKARKAAVQSGGNDVEYVPKGGEVDTAPKKKRQLGKRRTVTESGTQSASTSAKGNQLRRSTRGKQ